MMTVALKLLEDEFIFNIYWSFWLTFEKIE